MDGAPSVLFVLFEGLPDTVIDSQVLGHARVLGDAGAARFEVWTFACSAALYRRSIEKRAAAEAAAGCPVRVFRGVRPAVPGSAGLNARRLALALRRHRPACDVIHARTDYTADVCARLPADLRRTLIWDCRGDLLAEFDLRLEAAGPLRRPAFRLRRGTIAETRRRAAAGCDRAIFVSEPLRQLCAPLLGGKLAAVLPCAASEEQFFFDPARRQRMRAHLGYGEADHVLVYSGSLAPYQGFDEVVDGFARRRAEAPETRLLVLTPAVEAARRRLAAVDPAAVTVASVGHEEVNDYLNAADTAFLLRPESPVNAVASPTKFAEYCLAGLQVIMRDTVRHAFTMARDLGNLIEADDGGLPAPMPTEARARVALAARERLGKCGQIPLYRKLYDGTL